MNVQLQSLFRELRSWCACNVGASGIGEGLGLGLGLEGGLRAARGELRGGMNLYMTPCCTFRANSAWFSVGVE